MSTDPPVICRHATLSPRKWETRRDPHAARGTGSQKAPEEATSPVVPRTLMGRVAFRRHRLGPSHPARETDPTECSFTPSDTAFIDHHGLDFHLLTEIKKTTQTHHPSQAPLHPVVTIVPASRTAFRDQTHSGAARRKARSSQDQPDSPATGPAPRLLAPPQKNSAQFPWSEPDDEGPRPYNGLAQLLLSSGMWRNWQTRRT